MKSAAWVAAPVIAALIAHSAGAGDRVTVRTEPRTYPVRTGRQSKANWSPSQAAKLDGKDSYTTEAVILENRYLRLTVLPELGGRLVHAVYKPTGAELFWQHDRIVDGVSWSMGGGRWSFPFWEHGRHFDETGGYAVVRHEGGGVTVAIDMRFERFLKPAETRRYGRATDLRLVQLLRLEPDSAAFTWTGRVENPLPIRHGFKLWYLLRQPAREGIEIILPAAAVTGHGAPELMRWNRDTRVGSAQFSRFAVGIRHGFAGWYLPKRGLNVLRVVDPDRAPGAKQVLYPAGKRGYIEMWGGNHEVFEECGRILPAFGGFELPVTVLAAPGIGRADFANRRVAVSCRRTDEGWQVGLVPTSPIRGATLTLGAGPASRTVRDIAARPDRPFRTTVGGLDGAEEVVLVLRGPEGKMLCRQRFPVDAGPMPAEQFQRVQARVRGTIPGGKGLYAEATDLVSEHQASLVRTAGMNEKVLGSAGDTRALLDAARRLMRVRKGSEKVPAGLNKVLADSPANPWANLYKGMWLLEAGRQQEAGPCLAKARSLPGARYLLALEAVRTHNDAEAVEYLRSLLRTKPAASFYGPDDPARKLLQRGAFVSATRPRLLLAILHERLGRSDESRAILEHVTQRDPACIEAWMLLDNREKVRTLTRRNPAGKRAAEKTLEALRQGRWRGIGRP